MQFIHITNEKNLTTNDLFRQACTKRGIEYVEIDAKEFSFVAPVKHKNGDLLYRSAADARARAVERFLAQKELITFYQSRERINMSTYPISIYREHGVRQPKTIDWIPSDHEELEIAAKSLGGFPLIVKAMGGSHGVGVMKVDSLSSLRSLSDYFSKKKLPVIMREFIPGGKSARLIVLGNKVIDSIEYRAPKKDFRSNVGKNPIVAPKKFSPAIQKLAVQAVQTLGLEFGGVDVLIHKGKGYIAESNFPCFFPRCSMVTEVDIAGKMIDYLLRKRKKLMKK